MSKTQKQTNTTTADPTTLKREQQMWNTASGLAASPYQAYNADRVAGFTGDQQAGFGMARQAATAGQGALQQGMGIAGDLGGYQAQQVNGVPAAIAQAGVGGAPVSAEQVAAQQAKARMFTDFDLSQYLNPWTQNVVDATLSDADRARQMAIQSGQAQAAQAGAFGGSRHGVSDSLTNEAAIRNATAAAAQLRSQGFTNAQGAIMQDANRDLGAQQGNQQASLQAGIANQGAGLAAQQANQSRDIFNTQALNQGNQFNAGMEFNAQTANQGADMAAAGIRGNAAGMLGQFGAQQQDMGLRGADALTRIGGMQQGLNQAGLDVSYDNWLQKQNDPYNKLSFLNGFRGTPGQTNTQTQKGSMLGGILGAAGTILGGPLGGKIGGLFGGGGIPAAPTFMSTASLPTMNFNFGGG